MWDSFIPKLLTPYLVTAKFHYCFRRIVPLEHSASQSAFSLQSKSLKWPTHK